MFRFPINGCNFSMICKTSLVMRKCSTKLWFLYWIMKKLEYPVVLQALTQSSTSFVINKSTLQKTWNWCKTTLSFTCSTNNLVPCAMKFVVRSVINFMVSFSTLKHTKHNSCNHKKMWRKIINNNNLGGVAIAGYNWTKENK